jgi:predicted small secreted protein
LLLFSEKLKISIYETVILSLVLCGCETCSVGVGKNIKYRCVKAKYSGNYLDIRKMK